MRHISAKILAGFSAIVLAMGIATVVNPPEANACPASVVLAVGGVGDGEAKVFTGRADVRVKYSGNLNAVEEGVAVLKGHVDWWNRNCGNTRLIISGYSQGAAIAHVFLTRHGHEISHKAHGVLFSDPKMLNSGESNGLFMLGGRPVAGTDANFGGVPTASLCYHDDIICNRVAPSGWYGYAFLGKHGNYDLQPRKYDRVVGHFYY